MTIVTPMYMYLLFFSELHGMLIYGVRICQDAQSWLRVSVLLSGFVGHALACTHCSPMLTSSTEQVPEAAATVEEQEGSV